MKLAVLLIGIFLLISIASAAAPIANFTSNVTSGIVPFSVKFTDSTQPGGFKDPFTQNWSANYTGDISSFNWTNGSYLVQTTSQKQISYNTKYGTGNYSVDFYDSSELNSDLYSGIFFGSVTQDTGRGVTHGNKYLVSFNYLGNQMILWKIVSGAGAVIDANNPTLTPGNWYNLSVNWNITTGSIKIYINNILQLNKTDTTFTSPGYAGLIAGDDGTNPPSIYKNFNITPPTSWSWSFGDANTSTDQNPTNTYSTPGTYTVSLNATNSDGSNTNTKTGYITAYSTVVSNFTATPLNGAVPLTVTFTDASLGSPSSWLWDFGDGTTSTSQNPTHVYSQRQGTSFTVSLTATNGGSSDTNTKHGYISTVTSTTPGGLDCNSATATVAAAVSLISLALLILAAALIYAAFGGISNPSMSSTRTYRSEKKQDFIEGVDVRLILSGVVTFFIGAILLILSLTILAPLIGAAGC